MDDLTLDRLIAQTLVDEYGWDEEEAEEAVAAWRDSGSDGGWDADAIAAQGQANRREVHRIRVLGVHVLVDISRHRHRPRPQRSHR